LDEKCQSKKVPALAWGQGHKLQASSAIKKPQMIFKTILEFEKDKI
jgi:hypothetical protein